MRQLSQKELAVTAAACRRFGFAAGAELFDNAALEDEEAEEEEEEEFADE